MLSREQVLRAFVKGFGNEVIRQEFGLEVGALTTAEASYIASFRNADSLRDRRGKAQGAGNTRSRPSAVRESREQEVAPQRTPAMDLLSRARFAGAVERDKRVLARLSRSAMQPAVVVSLPRPLAMLLLGCTTPRTYLPRPRP
jgi:hypothetical protein